ncbi:MAG: hypothetical protein H3Z53_03290 [archaeon]|nr:hypothetical protein [archaeon]MCP8313387.1 hypothetical protein [archaeon]MCP8322548.1 hypothetical protein [archaeon]
MPGALPCFEGFGTKAIESVEHFLGLNTLIEIAMPPVKISVDYRTLLEKFKNLLTISFKFDVSKGGLRAS